jgi:hypothetical protein
VEEKQRCYLTNISPEFTLIYWLSVNHIFGLDDIEGISDAGEQFLLVLLFSNITAATVT